MTTSTALLPATGLGHPTAELATNRTPGRQARRTSRRATTAAAIVLAALALVLGPMATASQASGLLPALPTARCYPYHSVNQALVQVHPPQMLSSRSTVPIYVGGDTQTVRYQPYLQRWNGSTWVTIVNGPMFTGVASQNGVTWYGSSGGLAQFTVSRAASTQYYRVVASLPWVADPTHAGYSPSGVVEHRQFSSIYGWPLVSCCAY